MVEMGCFMLTGGHLMMREINRGWNDDDDINCGRQSFKSEDVDAWRDSV